MVGGRSRALKGGLLLAFAACALFAAGSASASSYGGSGNWTIIAVANEVDTGEAINVAGNVTVLGSLTLVNSTVTVDRNVSLTGSLTLVNSTLRFTVDGFGTNYITSGVGAHLIVRNGSTIAADAYAFNGTFGAGTELNFSGSRVLLAGWFDASTNNTSAGFRADRPRLSALNTTFLGGFEAFDLNYTGAAESALLVNTTFDGLASAVRLQGGAGHRFDRVHLANFTYGLQLNRTVNTTVESLDARLAVAGAVLPNGPPTGTAVAFEGSSDIAVLNLTLEGTPLQVAPRYLTGVVARNSTGLLLRNFQGAWGDSPGLIFQTSDTLIDTAALANFTTPLLVLSCTNLTVLQFHGAGESAAVQASATSNIVVRGLFADGLLVPAFSAFGGSGKFTVDDVVVSNSLGAVNLGGSATAPRFANFTLTNVTYGAQLSLADPSGARFEAFVARTVLRSVIEMTFTSGSGVTLVDFDLTDVRGVVANYTGTALSNADFGRLRLNGIDGDALLLNVSLLDNLSVYAVNASAHLGALLRLNTSLAADVRLFDVLSYNSTGQIAVLEGGAFARISASNITLTFGDLPPAAGPPAAIVVDASGANDGASPGAVVALTVVDLTINTSNRGAVFVQAPLGGSLSAARLWLDSLQLEGIRVIAGNASFAASVSALRYNGTGAAAVRLEQVSGAVLSGLDVSAASAVQLDSSSDIDIANVRHDGTYAGLHATGGGPITLRDAISNGTFGVDAAQVAGLTVLNLTARADGWALRATYSSTLTVDRLRSTLSTHGVALLGVAGASLTNLSLEFRGDGFVVGQGSSDIAARGLAMRSLPLVTARTALDLSFSSRVAVSDFVFTGRCEDAASLDTLTSADLTDFAADTCGRGVTVIGARFLNLTHLFAVNAYNGSALSISTSRDLAVTGAELGGARDDGIQLSSIDRAVIAGVNASLAGGDGAFIAFAANTTMDRLLLNGAAGTGVHILYSSRNVTLRNIDATRALAGIELVVSPNITLANVNASDNAGIGVFTDLQSGGVTLRNITASNNRWNGVLVSRNGTRLIDGNFSANGDPGFAAAPSVRLDWTIEGTASLTDETIELTGDLLLGPGSALQVTRSNLTFEQTVRRRALEPFALVSLGDRSSLTLDQSNLSARDQRVPYTIVAGASARLILSHAALKGGGTSDATSSVNVSYGEVHASEASFSNWWQPLRIDHGLLDCDQCSFTVNRKGPDASDSTVVLRALYTRENDFEGLSVAVSPLTTLDGATIQYNHGIGARFFGVDYLRLADADVFFNDLGGLEVLSSNLSGSAVGSNNSGGFGLRVAGGSTAAIARLWSADNAGAGASFEDLASLDLTQIEIARNHASGLQLLRVGEARVSVGTIGGSTLYGLFAQDAREAVVEAVSFGGDAGGAVRTEGLTRVSVGNASVASDADYAITLFGTSRATLANLVITAPASGLLAAQSSEAVVINSTMDEPTVVDDAVVTIAWYLRVLVQDASGYPASGVQVNVTNVTGSPAAAASTNVGGSTPLLPVAEREVRAANRETLFGPQAVAAAHPTLGRAFAGINVTRYTALGLKLDNRTPTTEVEYGGERGPAGWFFSAVEVRLRAADDGVGDVRLYWRVGGEPWSDLVGSLGTAAASLLLDAEGTTVVEFYAIDEAGNREGVHREEVRIDTAPPTARFVAQPPVVFNATLLLAWSATDGGGSGPSLYRIESAKDGAAAVLWLDNATATEAAFSAADGSYEFRLIAYDAAGHPSDPVLMTVRVALVGGLRVRVVDHAGNPIANVTVEVIGGPTQSNVTGPLVLTGLPPGTLTMNLTAGGYETKTLVVVVSAGDVADLGDIEMTPKAQGGGGFDLTLGYFVMAALLVLTFAYWINMRHKWDKRKREREELAEAERKAEKSRRRRR